MFSFPHIFEIAHACNNLENYNLDGTLKNINDDSVIMGYPAINYMDYNKSYVHFKNLPKVMQFIYNLMKKDVK